MSLVFNRGTSIEPKKVKICKDNIHVKLVWLIKDTDYTFIEEHYFQSEWKEQIKKWTEFITGITVYSEAYLRIALVYQWDLDVEVKNELDQALASGEDYVIWDSNGNIVFSLTIKDIAFLQLMQWRHPVNKDGSYCEVDNVYVIKYKEIRFI